MPVITEVQLYKSPRKARRSPKLARSATKGAKVGKVTKKKKKGISGLKKRLDQIFSLYIRTRDKGQCYTCPRKDEIKKMQNGHFVPRQYLAVRWDEVNNHCQCYACNMLYNGQPGAYAVRLELDYGQGTVARLEARRKEITKLTPEWYEEQIAVFAEKLKNL